MGSRILTPDFALYLLHDSNDPDAMSGTHSINQTELLMHKGGTSDE